MPSSGATTVHPAQAPGMPLLPTWQDHGPLLGPQELRAWAHTHMPRASTGTQSSQRLCETQPLCPTNRRGCVSRVEAPREQAEMWGIPRV